MPQGIVGAVQELGSVLGPVLGSFVLSVGTWRDIFWLNAVAGVLLTLGLVALGGRGAAQSQGQGQGKRYRIHQALAVVGLAVLLLALAAPAKLANSVALGTPFVPFGSATSRLATPVGVSPSPSLLVAGVLGARKWQPILRQADLPGALLMGPPSAA